MRYLYIIVFVYLFVGCSVKMPKDRGEIYDLTHIPQKVGVYTTHIKDDNYMCINKSNYEKSYFRVWNISRPEGSVSSVKWAFKAYKYGSSYAENLKLIDKSFFDSMYKNSNFNNFATINKKAITLKYSNIRAFPTIKPLFRNPKLAGEGFPFDYMQNSSIEANKPIFVSHYSRDRAWVYIYSSFTSGWLKSDEIAFIDDNHAKIWKKSEHIFITKDGIPIYDMNNNFLFKSRIGMMLPLVSEDKNSYTVLTVASYKNSQALYTKSKISKKIAHKGILKFNAKNMENILKEISKTKYGWGGLYEDRDCSSSLRDIFAPFGIWIPRNSSKQAKVGKIISLDSLNDEEKIKLIKEKAIAFKTFLYKHGHILLYVGTYKNKIIVFHNTWGIKTLKDGVEGRIIIGKPVFSTLKLGSHQRYYDKNSELLRNIKSMNIIAN